MSGCVCRLKAATIPKPTGLHLPLSTSSIAGPIAVKAAIWTVVEQMYARNISLLYAGPVSSMSEVRAS